MNPPQPWKNYPPNVQELSLMLKMVHASFQSSKTRLSVRRRPLFDIVLKALSAL
jgi:hypothetical protein